MRWGKLDILMLNAATLGSLTPVAQIDGKEFNRVLTLNVLASQALIAGFDPLLRKSEAGRLLAITSSVGRHPRAYWGAYGASKAALETLALAYAEEVRNLSPVRVAIVDPGSTATDDARPRLSRRGPGDPQAAERGGGGGGGAAGAGLRDGGEAGGSLTRHAGEGRDLSDERSRRCHRGTPAFAGVTGSFLHQGHLRHVDAAAPEAAFAIHQVIAPQAVEGLVEAGGKPPLRHRLVVADAPALQGLGIMEAEALRGPATRARASAPAPRASPR